ncbi:uncharacterized protein B0H18DRAFT_1039185 [Fomitopsis serialis]|uniref:uncharacterized protein n=1 Tax=Fomitopsis serialis TaxID=139415 RepID=UPI0020085256|nr:uncharacterized protein B0H18DRAFT_1039185 [Neoantrodia serialis]KAH9916078.1 hypothetical protein B0H18DRAFT_1039185 [Neoantrodia serialis]
MLTVAVRVILPCTRLLAHPPTRSLMRLCSSTVSTCHLPCALAVGVHTVLHAAGSCSCS